MDSRLKSLNRALKNYDSKLYAERRHTDGKILIMRKSDFNVSAPHIIFPLTENWKMDGRPAEWGIEPIIARLKAHDLWRDDTFVTNFLKEEDKYNEGRDRDRKNSIESFLYDFRSQFAKATKDINTSGMKTPLRKERNYGSR